MTGMGARRSGFLAWGFGCSPFLSMLLATGCTCAANGTQPDAAAPFVDAGLDSGREDSGGPDSGMPDAGTRDSGTADSGTRDSGAVDSGVPPDAGLGDGSVGAGQATYSCPDGGIDVQPTDDAAGKINGAPAGAILCIHGAHYLSATVTPKANQQIIGVDTNARLSGAQLLTGWQATDAGLWSYVGQPVPATPNLSDGNLGGGKIPCFCVSTYTDDVFYDDQRMMRVLSLAQLSGAAPLPLGQAVTPAEFGRFFIDYPNQTVYVDHDPTGHTVELAVFDSVITGAFGGDHVRVSNLFLEKSRGDVLCYGGQYCSYAKAWTLTDSTVRYAHNVGIQGGEGNGPSDRVTYLRTLITNNGQYGIASGGSWELLQDCELSWNNIANYRALNTGTACDTGTCGGYWGAGACKFVLTEGTTTNPGLWVVNLNSHDNVGPGFWTDVNNQYTTLQGGRLHGNEGSGYDHEISCDIDIGGVEIDHNGTPIKNNPIPAGGWGITVNDSNNANIHDNLIHDNASGGIAFIWQQNHTGLCKACLLGGAPPDAGCDSDTSHALKNDNAQSNQIYECAGFSGTAYGNFTLTSRNDAFQGNTYHVPSTTGSYWRDAALEDWTAWHAAEESTGSAATPCTYP
jgi:hypothetical protein